MHKLLRTAIPLGMLMAGEAFAEPMAISRNGERASVAGPANTFTGQVTVTPMFSASKHSNASGGLVEFTPGARSNWHTHPAGQTLVITSGTGWVQQEGDEKIEIKPGDVIWTPPGVKHWHGATSKNSMSHIAVTPSVDGKNVDWMEPVTDDQYR
jgi:quercetin dioxygenase-like cupin family protein